MFRVLVSTALLLVVTGCATIDYVGNSFPPTEHVDLFFAEEDVPREYEVVGQVLATGDQYTSAARLQEKMMARAREKGADGVIILDVVRRRLTDAQRIEETIVESKDEKGGTVKKSVSVSNPSAEGREIHALFIKYR